MTTGIKLSAFTTITDRTGFYVIGVQSGGNVKMLAELLTGEGGYNAENVPRLELYSDYEGTTIAQSPGVWADYDFDVFALDSNANNYFTSNGDGSVTYTGNPALITFIDSNQFLRSGSGGNLELRQFLRNNLAVKSDTVVGIQGDGRYNGDIHSETFFIQFGDVIRSQIQNTQSSSDYIFYKCERTADFKGWIDESDLMGDELFSNPNIDDDTGFTTFNATQDDTTPGELLVTTTAAAGGTDASITGLEIGERYRVVASAKRGAQGTDQAVGFTDWGNTTTYDILTTSEETVVIDIVATATSGFFRFQAAAVGAIGDEIIVTGLSVRKYLV